MSLTVKLLLVAALVLGIIIPFGYYLIGEKNKKRDKTSAAAYSCYIFSRGIHNLRITGMTTSSPAPTACRMPFLYPPETSTAIPPT